MNKILAKLLTCMIRDKKLRKERRKELINGISNPNKIKLIMTLLVKDEEDIIGTNIRFHKEMGVDGFIVTNNNSTDNTLQILNKLKNEGLVLEIIDEKDETYKQEIWVDKMIRLAKHKYKADWVINADADEFYYSKDLNLKQSICKYPKINAIKVESTFSFPIDINNCLENPYFNTNPIKDFEYPLLYEGGNEYLRYFSIENTRTCPKVFHSTKGYIMNVKGNHDVIMKNKILANNNDIILYHYHIPNYKRYEAKAKRWALSAKHLTVGENYLTKMVRLFNQGKLRDFYNLYYGEQMRNMLIDKGVVTPDFSVYNFLKYKGLL